MAALRGKIRRSAVPRGAWSYGWPTAVAFVLALFAATAAPGALDPEQELRVQPGVRLFRSMLAADLDIDKKALADGRLLVVFIYTDDERRARALAERFKAAPIGKSPVVVEVAADDALDAAAPRTPAGVFLTQPPGAKALRQVIDFGKARRILVYSPFEGHVEDGVPGGLSVEAQVRPYVNRRALADSGIVLKEFFLKAAKVHR